MRHPRDTPIDQGVILITGASSGIGRHVAMDVARRARALVLVARRKDRLDALADELRAAHPKLTVAVFGCDVTDRASVDGVLEKVEQTVGAVDVLVNNAGLGDLSVFDRSDMGKQDRMMALNVTSLVYLTHRLVGSMVSRGRGGILNIGSSFGLTFGPGFATYVGTKYFVTGFSESLRADLFGTGVRVTLVCPGPVATEFEANVGNATGLTVPKFLEITPTACARAAVRAFDARRARVIPGFWIKLLMWVGMHSPQWIVRGVYGRAALMLRRRQLASSVG